MCFGRMPEVRNSGAGACLICPGRCFSMSRDGGCGPRLVIVVHDHAFVDDGINQSGVQSGIDQIVIRGSDYQSSYRAGKISGDDDVRVVNV